MPDSYLLKCGNCQSDIAVTLTQAGQDLACVECGTNTMAPNMGGIRKLPRADDAATKTDRPANYSPLQRWLFAGGLTMAVIFGGIASVLYWQSSTRTSQFGIDVQLILDDHEKVISQMPPSQIYSISIEAGSEDFVPEYQEPFYRSEAKRGSIMTVVSYIFAGVSILGLLMIVSSLLMGGIGSRRR